MSKGPGRAASALREILRESAHGGFWKLLAFAGQGLFLLAVLPGLPGGQLAEYVLISSVALILSRIVLFGREDEIPLEISGNRELMRARGTWILPFAGALLLLGGLAWVLGTRLPALAFLAGVVALSRHVAGLIRSVAPQAYEQLANVPWILFSGAALASGLDSAPELVVLRGACVLLVVVIVAAGHRVLSVPQRSGGRVRPTMATGRAWFAGGSLDKLLSNVGLIVMMRGFILWPQLGAAGPYMDAVAFAMACGEVLWQMGMIFAHRRYALYARFEGVLTSIASRERQLATVLLLALIAAGGVGVLALTLVPRISGAMNLAISLASVPFFAGTVVFCLLRFWWWALRARGSVLVAAQAALILVQGAIVFLLPAGLWFGAGSVAVLGATLALTWLIGRARPPSG